MGNAIKFARIGGMLWSTLFFSTHVCAEDGGPTAPPLVPQNELAVPDDEALIEKCMAHVPPALGIEIGATRTSRSAGWGLVWRADFTFPKSGAVKGINRIVCKEALGNSP